MSRGAFDNRIIGIKGFIMGNALTGIADDVSAVHYNPAGLVFNEHTWDTEIYRYEHCWSLCQWV